MHCPISSLFLTSSKSERLSIASEIKIKKNSFPNTQVFYLNLTPLSLRFSVSLGLQDFLTNKCFMVSYVDCSIRHISYFWWWQMQTDISIGNFVILFFSKTVLRMFWRTTVICVEDLTWKINLPKNAMNSWTFSCYNFLLLSKWIIRTRVHWWT